MLAFDFALQFLYGKPFSELKERLVLTIEPGTTDVQSSTPACEVLCFALKYELTELGDALVSYFQEIRDVSYRLVLAATKHIYNHAPKVEPWFKSFIQERTQDALTVKPDLVDETWFLEMFERGHRGLSRHLFECYRDWCRFPQRDALTPTSDRNKFTGLEKHNQDRPHLEDSSSLSHQTAPADSNDLPPTKATVNDPGIFESSAEPQSFSATEPEHNTVEVPWDHGLSAKERRMKREEMRLYGTWSRRVTQKMLDDEKAIREAFAKRDPEDVGFELGSAIEPLTSLPSPPTQTILEHDVQPLIAPESDPGPMEERQPWDFGLNAKEKKKMRKLMQLHGTWDTRLTQEMIDREARTAALSNFEPPEVDYEPCPGPESDSMQKPWSGVEPTDVIDQSRDWVSRDWEVPITKTKRENTSAPVSGHGTPLEEPTIDKDGWAPKKKKSKKKKPHPSTEIAPESDPNQEPRTVVEKWEDSVVPSEHEPQPVFIFGLDSGSTQEQQPWNFGLGPEETKDKKREMKLNGTWATRVTAAMINEELTFATTLVEKAGNMLAPEANPDSINRQPSAWSYEWMREPTVNNEHEAVAFSDHVPPDEETIEDAWTVPKVVPKKKKRDKKKPRPEPEPVLDPVES